MAIWHDYSLYTVLVAKVTRYFFIGLDLGDITAI